MLSYILNSVLYIYRERIGSQFGVRNSVVSVWAFRRWINIELVLLDRVSFRASVAAVFYCMGNIFDCVGYMFEL